MHYPLTLRIPTVREPSVVSLLDLQHLDLPALFSRSERAFRAVAWHRSVRGADRVITISSFVRDRAVELLGLDPARVHAIHLGIDHERFTPGAEVEREAFLLYPARRWPHKNHERLFEAFALLRRERPGLRLVLTGGGHDGPVPDGVEVRGNVPAGRARRPLSPRGARSSSRRCTRASASRRSRRWRAAARSRARTSRRCPRSSATRRGSSTRTTPSAIADAVRDVLAAPEEWSARGLERARLFSWEATARAHEDVYRTLAGS